MMMETFFMAEIPHAYGVRNFRDHAGPRPSGTKRHDRVAPARSLVEFP
jgi:hypothetical protein